MTRPHPLALAAVVPLLFACGPRLAAEGGSDSSESAGTEGDSDAGGSESTSDEGEVGECEVVEFEDPSLELYVRWALDLGDQPITGEALDELTTIHVEYPADLEPLRSLQGLECAHNLEVLDWRGESSPNQPVPDQVSDLSPLAGLTNLRKLDLSKHSIVDLTPLAGLTQLEELDLSLNLITDFSALPGVPTISLFYNLELSDVSPLLSFPELTSIYLASTKITDLTPLIGATWDTPEGCGDLYFMYEPELFPDNSLDEYSATVIVPQICADNPNIAVWLTVGGPDCNGKSSCTCLNSPNNPWCE